MIELVGLNTRQQVLADIMWDLQEYDDVERFMLALPERERIECEGIIAMMRMAVMEYNLLGEQDTQEARRVIKGVVDKR
jgi:hypothetical protein